MNCRTRRRPGTMWQQQALVRCSGLYKTGDKIARTTLQRHDDEAQRHRQSDTNSFLILLTNVPCGVKLLSSATTERAAEAASGRC